MPSLGADMQAGKLVEWLVGPGDTVHRGDVVAVVETQKGAIEIEIFQDGTIKELLADLGQDLPVGAPLAHVMADREEAAPATPEGTEIVAPAPKDPMREPDLEPAHTTAAHAVAAGSEAPMPTAEEPERDGRRLDATAHAPAAEMHRASPAARHLAKRLGVDISALKGSGPGGAILYADVEKGASRAAVSKPSPMDEMRKAIAAAMTRAKRTIPHFYLTETIDVDPAIAYLEKRNAGAPPSGRILLGALFVRATVLAATKVKVMNGHYTEESGFVPSDVVNPGVAIALRGGGLVAPALMDAGSMTLEETMAGMRDLVTRARAGRLRSSEMTQGTITVSSLGDTGAEAMTGVIFPPQVALVGLGAPHLRPWVVDTAVVPRHVVTLTLSADHRVSDGRTAARFIAEFEDLMQRPEDL